MKTLLLFITLISYSFATQYTFLVNKYDKEIELEAKIVSKIAANSLGESVKLYIPEISKNEEEIYSKFFLLAKSCEDSNFVFVKKQINIESLCQNKDKLFFTNNYQKLLSSEQYFGAFFWNKSRPNIVFIKKRLKTKDIILPDEYHQFIEDF